MKHDQGGVVRSPSVQSQEGIARLFETEENWWCRLPVGWATRCSNLPWDDRWQSSLAVNFLSVVTVSPRIQMRTLFNQTDSAFWSR